MSSKPSAADKATLDTLGIRTVYDLRTPAEIEQQPDHPPSGANELPVNLLGTEDNPTPFLGSAAEAVSLMESSYRTFVTHALTRQRLAEVLRSLASASGSQLYHCSGGKDRTDWVTAVLLTVLEVPQSVILGNYMLTNSYSAPSIEASYQEMIASHGKSYADIYLPLLIAKEGYLLAAYDQAIASYGSMMDYVRNGIGLDAATEMRLRLRLLTSESMIALF
jgi:protein-tyrosine phosphatase